MNKFFVMIHRQDGSGVLPLTSDGEVAMFSTMEEAMDAGDNDDMAISFGFDVYQMCGGIDGRDGL